MVALLDSTSYQKLINTLIENQIRDSLTLSLWLRMRLTRATLDQLPQEIQRPAYDLMQVTPGVVHLGFGNFHRAHQAVFFDELLAHGHMEWGIVGVKPFHDRHLQELRDQDHLYTLTMAEGDRQNSRVIGSICDIMYAPQDRLAVLERMASASTHVVTLTVTQKGYCTGHDGKHLNLSHPDIQHDLVERDSPRSVIGLITRALVLREKRGLPPFTVISCDNVPRNGDLVRRMIVEFAQKACPELLPYVEGQGAFPNSVVDRITPYADFTRNRETLFGKHKIEDAVPLVSETFLQWIIEDKFSSNRPPLDLVGVKFVDDITPYEQLKLKLVNGGHLALGLVGFLSGFSHVHMAANDPHIENFTRRFVDQAARTLHIDGYDIWAYAKTVIPRFQNSAINDTIQRLLSHTSGKIESRVINGGAIKKGEDYDASAFAVATWIRFMRGEDASGNQVNIEDRHLEHIQPVVCHSGFDIETFIAREEIFGRNANMRHFTDKIRYYLNSIEEHGVYNALQRAFPLAGAQVQHRFASGARPVGAKLAYGE